MEEFEVFKESILEQYSIAQKQRARDKSDNVRNEGV